MLTSFTTAGGPTFSFDASHASDIDGLGRLIIADETIGAVGYNYAFSYDMRSDLKEASLTNQVPVTLYNYSAMNYDKAGNLITYTYNGSPKSFTHSGDLTTGDGTQSVNWDENGRQVSRLSGTPQNYLLEYDWDGKLRKGRDGLTAKTMEAKYAPDSSVRLTKKRIYNDGSSYNHKYIVDMSGGLSLVLLVLDADRDNLIFKSYVYANSQVLAQQNGNHTANRYFYLHDRLGSVREVIDQDGTMVNHYTYEPWGLALTSETSESISNLYRYAGYVYDAEISQYYCVNRQYDPILGRFTSKDPISGQFEEPMSLHKYLYCLNNPINFTDPEGLWTIHVMLSGTFSFGPSLMYQRGIVIDDQGNWGEIITSDDPHPIEGLDGDWGLGLGIPTVSAGVAVGWTNADTIYDLPGAGITIGGSYNWSIFGVGVDYIKGIQRNGEYYHGFEVVPEVGTPGWEVHGQATWTTVNPFESNLRNVLGIDDIVQESVENSLFNAQTLGQSEALLSIWSNLP